MRPPRYNHTIDEQAFIRKTTHAQLINHVPAGSTVLEIGCSTGYVSRYLREMKGCVVTGIEVDPDAAGQAAAFCRQILIGDIEKEDLLDPLKGQQFDVILLGDVLEHLINPQLVLARLKGFLSPSGKVLISVPNVANWRIRLNLATGKFQYSDEGLLDKTHLRFFTYRSLREMIEKTGYRIYDMGYSAGDGRFLPMLLSRLFPGLLSFQFIVECRPSMAKSNEPGHLGTDTKTFQCYDFSMAENPKTTHAQIIHLVGRNKRVLEIGCHTGRVAKHLAEQGCSIVGVELNEAAACEAQSYCKEIIVGDIERSETLQRISGLYDVIVFGDVLEHLVDPGRVLQGIQRLLDARGYMVITLPNIANFKIRLQLLAGRFQYQDTGILDRSHLRFFTLDTVLQMIRENGYIVDYFNVASMNMPMFIMKLNPRLFAPQFVLKIRPDHAGG